MINFKIILLLISLFVISLSASTESFFHKSTNSVRSTTTTVEEPANTPLTYVQRFEESANISIWKDVNTSKIYIKVYPITDKIFIASDTHMIRQFNGDEENTFTLKLINLDDSSEFFSYVYKDNPKILEVKVDEGQNFNVDKTFDFMFENTYKVSLNQEDNGQECVILNMKKGWSLVSLPVNITLTKNSTDANTSMSRLGSYDVIYTYSSDANWTKNPDSITAGEGFWIKRDSEYSTQFCGNAYNPLLEELSEGWHLVGTGKTLYNISNIDYIDEAYKYNNGAWQKDFNTTVAGEGFWVKIGKKSNIIVHAQPDNLEDNTTAVPDALKFDLNSTNLTIIKLEEYKFKILDSNASDYTSYIGKALFLSNSFEGLVKDVNQNGSDVLIDTESTSDLKKVYDRIQFSFDGLTTSSSRTLVKDKNIYNYLNENPLKVSLSNKSRSLTKKGMFVQIAIPNNYKIQDANSASQSRVVKKVEIPISVDLTSGSGSVSLSFMTESGWSYLEFELAPKVNNFDYKILSFSPYLTYDMELKVANVQDIKFELSGKLSTDFYKKTFDIPLEIIIPIPVTAGSVSFSIKPKIDVSFTGEISGKYTMSYKNSYSKTSYYEFDTRLDEQKAPKTPLVVRDPIVYTSEFAAELSATMAIAPTLDLAPVIGIPHTDVSFRVFDVASGYELSYKATGKLVANESGLKEDYPFTKNYLVHDFFPWYVDTGAEGQLFASGKIDISSLPVIGGVYEMKFAPIPKQELWKMDLAGMPEPTVVEKTTEADEKKTLEISFPDSADSYLADIKVTYSGGEIDFSSGRTQTITDLEANTNYEFASEWKKGATTDGHDKSLVWSNDFSFRTSAYVDDNNSDGDDGVVDDDSNTSDDGKDKLLGKWTLHLKCVNQEEDASIFDIDMLASSSDSSVYSIQGKGNGTDYTGVAMAHVVNGSVDASSYDTHISVSTTFSGSEDVRTDTYTVNLDTNDTGYVRSVQSWYPNPDLSGCDAEFRLHR